MSHSRWSRSDIINSLTLLTSIVSLLVGAIGATATLLVVPEVREYFGLISKHTADVQLKTLDARLSNEHALRATSDSLLALCESQLSRSVRVDTTVDSGGSTICYEHERHSAIEARGIHLTSTTLSALRTAIIDDGRFRPTGDDSHLKYFTLEGDEVYLIAGRQGASGRIVTISCMPLNSLSVAERLDRNLLYVAHMYAKATDDHSDDVFDIFAGENRRFYSERYGQYQRQYVSASCPSGMIRIPNNASDFGCRFASYRHPLYNRRTISLTFGGGAPTRSTSSEDEDGFVLDRLPVSGERGNYTYAFEFSNWVPSRRVGYWFECTTDLHNSNIGDEECQSTPQPNVSEEISRLNIPQD